MVRLKRLMALLLALVMVLSLTYIPASAAGNLSLSCRVTSDEDGKEIINSIDANQEFYLFVSFSGNTQENLLRCYDLFISIPDAITDIAYNLNETYLTNATIVNGNIVAGWASPSGVVSKGKALESGDLFALAFVAPSALSADDVAAFGLLKGGNNDDGEYQESGFYSSEEPSSSAIIDTTGLSTSISEITLDKPSATADGDASDSITATAYDSQESPITSGITWTIQYGGKTLSSTPADNNVTISSSGVITVGKIAPAGEYTVVATGDGSDAVGSATKSFLVSHAGSDMTTFDVPAAINIGQQFTLTVKDQYNVEMVDGITVTATIDGSDVSLTKGTKNWTGKIESADYIGKKVTFSAVQGTTGETITVERVIRRADVKSIAVSMDSSSYNSVIDESITITVTVTDNDEGFKLPLKDASVTLTSSGNHVSITPPSTPVTDDNGNVSFVVKGASIGTDTLTAQASFVTADNKTLNADPAATATFKVDSKYTAKAEDFTGSATGGTYTGSAIDPKPQITKATGASADIGDLTNKFKYAKIENGKDGTPADSAIDAGTYRVYAEIAETARYNGGFVPTNVTFEIAKAARKLTAELASVVLTDNEPEKAVTINGFTKDPSDSNDALSVNSVISLTEASISDNTVTLKGIKKGTEDIKVGSAASANYEAVTDDNAATINVVVVVNPVVNATISGIEGLSVSLDEESKTIYVLGTADKDAEFTVTPEYDAEISGSLADPEGVTVKQGASNTFDVKLKDGTTVASTYTIDASDVVIKDAKVTVKEESTDVTTPDDASLSSIDYTTGETKVEGVANADYTNLLNIGKDVPSNKVTVTVTPTIAPTSYNASDGTMDIDISFTYTVKDEDGKAIAEKITIDEFNRPVLVSVQIPAKFIPAVAKNKHGDKTSYMAVTISNGKDDSYKIASWWQSKFSTTTLEADLAGSITFVENNQTIPYNKLSLNSPEFPEAEGAPSGMKYKDWDIYIDNELKYPAVKALDDVILKDIHGKTAIAKANWSDAGSPFIPSSSGSSSSGPDVTPMYKLNNTVSTNGHGTVSLSDTITYAGRTITLNVKPDEGYKLGSLNVTDAKGNKIAVTEKDGKYTFTMPASNINVSATFVQGDAAAPVNPSAKINFSDVPANQWYSDPVAWAVEKDITNGMGTDSLGNQLFEPFSNCTRAQFVTFLWRAAGKPVASATSAFSDVVAGSYYENAVRWAVANGITNGKAEGLFMPNDLVTRAEAVTFLCRALKGSGSADSSSFTDVPTGTWYTAAVDWAIRNQITDGMGNNLFQPGTSLNRAMAVTFLQRAYK